MEIVCCLIRKWDADDADDAEKICFCLLRPITAYLLIADQALEVAMNLSVTWLPDRHLPDKALDLLDEACARARIPTISRPADRGAGLVVTARTVAEVLGEWQGISAEAVLGAG